MEANNAAALRDALIKALTLLSVCDWPPYVSLDGVAEVVREIDSALDKPPRNCDVGTAEEQTERFKKLCRKYRRGPGPRTNCKGCPVSIESHHVGCTFAWAQMPYEAQEGAEK